MTTLKAGDIRQPKDQKRRHTIHVSDYTLGYRDKYPEEFRWREVDLLGHVILQSDLMAFEFRRP